MLREARDQSLEVTTIAFNAVLDSPGPSPFRERWQVRCEKGARWELALHLLQEMWGS